MTPEDLKALRKDLSCTAKELAAALGTDQATVLAWERADAFPTKRLVEAMQTLREKGPSAIPRKKRGISTTPMQALASPDLWMLVRKLAVHTALREATLKLAADYSDPASDSAE